MPKCTNVDLETKIKASATKYHSKEDRDIQRYCISNCDALATTLKRRGFNRFRFIGAGCYANAYEIGKDCVLRVSRQKPKKLPEFIPFNRRVGLPFKLHKDSPYYFEIFPKVEIVGKLLKSSKLKQCEKDRLYKRFQHFDNCFYQRKFDCFYIDDTHEYNIGLTKSGNMVISDPGCVEEGPSERIYIVA
jgi:hypothetical protein